MDRPSTRLVLIVEDDLDVRNPLVKFLEMHGFSTVSVGTADEAIEVLAKDSVAAAIIDLRLRGRLGRDVVLAASPEIPVLILPGNPSETEELLRLRPRTRAILKPYSLVKLVTTLEEFLPARHNDESVGRTETCVEADRLTKLMRPDVRELLAVDRLSSEQQRALLQWGMRMYALGQHVVADITDVKYEGRLVILDDGTRWEVDDVDTGTAALWSMMDKVLVADGEMWKLDESEKVSVTEET